MDVKPLNGDVYVADSAHDVVDEFDSAGNYTGHRSPIRTSPIPATIALDSSGNLYVDERAFSNVVEFDAAGAFARMLDSDPAPLAWLSNRPPLTCMSAST